MEPAIKKRVDFYRSLVLLGPEDECGPGDLSFWENCFDAAGVVGVGSPPDLVRSMLGKSYYEATVLKTAADCFQLDPAKPLHQRILLLILAHVVFGKGRRRGRVKESKNWTTLRWHQLAALYMK